MSETYRDSAEVEAMKNELKELRTKLAAPAPPCTECRYSYFNGHALTCKGPPAHLANVYEGISGSSS